MNGADDRKNGRLAEEIRKQLAAPSTRRYYQSLPAFQTEERLPDGFDDLLAQLDAAMRDRHAD
ncbi:MAG: hypothetical protein JNL61_15130 [Rhizobiaceae bacterium]|nr:hypothetical protein [Rhizobiaceae bacterium]